MSDYYHFDEIPSTNTFAKENLHLFDPNTLSAITADRQTAGRGRRERSWISEEGNLFLSLVFFTQKKNTGSFGIQLAIALCEVLKKYHLDPKIKWPNDIQLQGKKVAGILGETVVNNQGIWVILGIGVNLNSQVDLPTSTALIEHIGPVDLKEFTQDLVETFNQKPLLSLLNQYSVHTPNSPITIKTDQEKLTGLFLYFGELGEIHLQVNGQDRSFFAGEIL